MSNRFEKLAIKVSNDIDIPVDQYAVAQHNRIYKEELPKITPHVCRHTFCSKMARKGMNPAKLKYIMDHSDIEVTFNTYTHLGFDDVKADMLGYESGAA